MKAYNPITKLGNRNPRKGIVEEATAFYKELYEEEDNKIQNIKFGNNNDEMVHPILRREVEHAINELRKDKMPGPDKIDNKILKTLKLSVTPILIKIFTAIVDTVIIPEQWEATEIRILYKKGDRKDIQNYRPISLSSVSYTHLTLPTIYSV